MNAHNVTTGKEYKGGNITRLAAPMAQYGNGAFLTFRQAKKLGGYVLPGQSGTPCLFMKREYKEDPKTGKTRRQRSVRKFTVFNVAQCHLPIEFLAEKGLTAFYNDPVETPEEQDSEAA